MGVVNQPHFDLPFRYDKGVAVVVQQDTLTDVRNCVEAAVRTEVGTRAWVPTFGISDITFENQPIDQALLAQQITTSEPRAHIDITQTIPDYDLLAERIVVGVNNG